MIDDTAKIDTAMVLMAGLGKRMRPLTDKVPKPLVPVLGRPLVDYNLDCLVKAGIKNIIVNMHHLADQVEEHINSLQEKSRKNKTSFLFSDERDELLETGGGVRKALPQLGQKAFIVLNSDTLWIEGDEPALNRMQENFDQSKMSGLLLLVPLKNSLGYNGTGDFVIDEEGKISRASETDNQAYVFMGVGIYSPDMFDHTPDGPFSLNLVFDQAIEQGKLYGLVHQGEWMHIGTMEGIKGAEKRLLELGFPYHH